MDAVKKFRLGSNLGHISAVVLIVCFFLSLIFTILPRLRFPTATEEWGWAVASWNIGGPLMFIMVFRIHALRVIRGRILREKVLSITLWVKFWFVAAAMFGMLTLPFLANTYLIGGAGMPWYLILGTAAVIITWLALLFSTLSLLKVKCSKALLPAVERARKIDRILLGPSSIVFLFFTGFSSITILFP